MTLEALLSSWRNDPELRRSFAASRILERRAASLRALPAELDEQVQAALRARGIERLYSHQTDTWSAARAGSSVVLATGTASGKTLAYNLPVIARLLEDPLARALYLFPTKALSQDQLKQFSGLASTLPQITAAIYDGDTPQANRAGIRSRARVVVSNPDMLHTGILPHHSNWAELLSHLEFVVIDEMHTYRGVFGSHVANVLRRLKRLAAHYGARPTFLMSSATIENPRELAERLIEEPVVLLDEDGSARGEQHFLIYNPPIVDPALGLRKSSVFETMRLAGDALDHGLQGVIFCGTRRMVEILLTYLQDQARGQRSRERETGNRPRIRGYRSGYLASERREIEAGLRDGSVRLVAATNALELGIDIGGLEAAFLLGYPGTIASARQQAGRAGRGDAPSVAVLVASPGPLDQYLARHPEYFFGKSPERGLINPDHLLILLEHLRCALFELPFRNGEGFGNVPGEKIREYLEFLTSSGEAHESRAQFFWMADKYPAAGISLRSASARRVVLQSISADGAPTTVGTVDAESATWMVHPGAVYMHEAQQYFVQDLDLEKGTAHLVPVALEYYTEPMQRTEISVLSTSAQMFTPGARKAWGEIEVTSRVAGFRKVRWVSRENLGEQPLELPPSEMQTTAYWLSIGAELIDVLRRSGAWNSDPNDYGPEWPNIRVQVRARDQFRCQSCGTPETVREHDVHHRRPFRAHPSAALANQLENLVTLCRRCHEAVEQDVRVRTGLGGLAFILGHLAPFFVMCDPSDLGVHVEAGVFETAEPAVVIYDQVPAGIGFSQQLYELHDELIGRCLETVTRCECADGCPSCVGPGGEHGMGSKRETLALLAGLAGHRRPAAR